MCPFALYILLFLCSCAPSTVFWAMTVDVCSLSPKSLCGSLSNVWLFNFQINIDVNNVAKKNCLFRDHVTHHKRAALQNPFIAVNRHWICSIPLSIDPAMRQRVDFGIIMHSIYKTSICERATIERGWIVPGWSATNRFQHHSISSSQRHPTTEPNHEHRRIAVVVDWGNRFLFGPEIISFVPSNKPLNLCQRQYTEYIESAQSRLCGQLQTRKIAAFSVFDLFEIGCS